MSYANLARLIGPSRPTIQKAPESRCGMAPHRGDVTPAQAASYVRLQQTTRIEKLQAHAPSHRTAGTAPLPVPNPRIGRA